MDESGDALRRTRLAGERTYLAWWRTGLTALAVAIGAGSIAPRLVGGERWSYAGVGAGFAVLGVSLLGYGLHRQLAVERAVEGGSHAPPDSRVLIALTVGGVVLGTLTLVLLLTSI